jgi:hypothetical protein
MVPAAENAPQDWRLEMTLEGGTRVRAADLVEQIKAKAGEDVVLTHDHERFFSYATTEAAVRAVRDAAQAVLDQDGVTAAVSLSHWDDDLDDWLRVDPPLDAGEASAQAAAKVDAEAVQTRTIVVKVGRAARTDFDESMRVASADLGVACTVVEEHPHLLSSQLALTLEGPRRKVDEFVEILGAEGSASIRTDTAILLSPL